MVRLEDPGVLGAQPLAACGDVQDLWRDDLPRFFLRELVAEFDETIERHLGDRCVGRRLWDVADAALLRAPIVEDVLR